MPAFPLLWPMIAMAALIFLVWFVLVVHRFGHMKANPPAADNFTSGSAAKRYFEPVERPANNLANLFELPILFFVIAILLIVTEMGNDVQVALAWGYVAARAVHSWLHIAGKPRPRFMTYVLSNALLIAMWVGFTVDTIGAARAYHATMATLEAESARP